MASTVSGTGAPSLKRPSPSFRLRCTSLNSLRLRRIFDMYDKNKDGFISVHEISQALALLGLETEISDLHSTIKSFIRPSNYGLNFDDFVSLHQSLYDTYFDNNNGDEEAVAAASEAASTDACDKETKLSQEESDLSEAFKVFDEDGDGYISAKELQVVLAKLGFQESNEIDRVEKMITSVDQNHDGLVDLFEFKNMMRTTVLVPSS
ncbi:calcium-binding protein CML42-like [Pyrus ussuriensis x Pyrus communis]|uniref:Calcium-binding protein CML42-like n=1 Tax=Pyrus ussuriensis x Pyrus communis TaxID=2448454 RepID=A0A5N5I450_9ROSA|nr:calcium-binding protein CML42-like [Pyrus ussuriensis x Pyrus communis]